MGDHNDDGRGQWVGAVIILAVAFWAFLGIVILAALVLSMTVR